MAGKIPGTTCLYLGTEEVDSATATRQRTPAPGVIGVKPLSECEIRIRMEDPVGTYHGNGDKPPTGMPSGTLTSNLVIGRRAVAFAAYQLRVGRGNDWHDIWVTRGQSFSCVSDARALGLEKGIPDNELFYRVIAMRAMKYGCGNCGECAALTFVYLEDAGVRPIELMSLKPPGDHNFVVIGRDPDSNLADVTTWGENAVLCDSWDRPGKAYPAVDAKNNMYENGWKHLPLAKVDYSVE